jgi:hypothetical protein
MAAFQLNITNTNQTEGKERKVVDWDALNQHVVEVSGTAKKSRSIPGVISGLYDLGNQKLEDAEKAFTGTAADEAAEIEKFPATYFKDGIDRETGKQARLKCWPQKPVQQIAFSIDFPQVLVDKGQFFGNSKPLPLRMLLNYEFTVPGTKEKIVARPYNLRDAKHDLGNGKAVWALAKNNGLHKLAAAAELLDDNGLFNKERAAELIGKVVQFEFRVWMKPAKTGDKTFFTEEIKLVGMVPEGVAIPEVPEGLLHCVNLHGENDPEAVKQMRVSVKNTMKRALNYDTSSLKPVFEAEAASYGSAKADPAKDAVKAAVAKAEVVPVQADFDSDIPF